MSVFESQLSWLSLLTFGADLVDPALLACALALLIVLLLETLILDVTIL